MQIETNGASLHVLTQGTGDTALVCLHYWGGSSRTWQPLAERLGDRFRIVAPVQRGWGASLGDGDYRLATLANDVRGVIDALGLQRYVLVGHSMGGKLAQLLASQRPAGLAGVVLVATAPPGPSVFPLEQRVMMSHAYDTAASAEATCSQVLTAKPLSVADRQQVVEDSLAGTIAAKQAWPMATMMEDISSEVSRIAVPVLVIAGELDQVDPVELIRSHVMPHLPSATLEVLGGTGHLSPLESPDELAGLIAGFVASL